MNSDDTVTGQIIVRLQADLFSKEGIFKCLYWYSANFTTDVVLNENTYTITLSPLDSSIGDESLQKVKVRLERDLFDYNLRQVVSTETKNIREILVAKAFSNGEFDEQPPGEVSDSVGYTPK